DEDDGDEGPDSGDGAGPDGDDGDADLDSGDETGLDADEDDEDREAKFDRIADFLKDLFAKVGIDADFYIDMDDEGVVYVDIKADDKESGLIIGKKGETLDAFQYITNLAVNKGKAGRYTKVVLDVENYRQKREETLIGLAMRTAERVMAVKKNMVLDPMTAFERRIVHTALQDNDKVETYSIGEEPNRKIIVKYRF
ncbi:MAG: KH domain-containing protein, partial [Oscillospiraceae bacterium]|nr:KH domain-containing protein [Oscillospiraceae bacterium]